MPATTIPARNPFARAWYSWIRYIVMVLMGIRVITIILTLSLLADPKFVVLAREGDGRAYHVLISNLTQNIPFVLVCLALLLIFRPKKAKPSSVPEIEMPAPQAASVNPE